MYRKWYRNCNISQTNRTYVVIIIDVTCSRSRKKSPGRSLSLSSASSCIRHSSLHCSPDSFSYRASSSSLGDKRREVREDLQSSSQQRWNGWLLIGPRHLKGTVLTASCFWASFLNKYTAKTVLFYMSIMCFWVSVTCSSLWSSVWLLHHFPGWSGSLLPPHSSVPADLTAASVLTGLQTSQRGSGTTARSPDRGRCGAQRTHTQRANFQCHTLEQIHYDSCILYVFADFFYFLPGSLLATG